MPACWEGGTNSDLLVMFECSEAMIRDRVLALAKSDLHMDMNDLVASLLPEFLLTPPDIDWPNSQVTIEEILNNINFSMWRIELSVPIGDPTYLLSYVDWLPDGDGDYYPDQERGRLMLAEHIQCETIIEAQLQFDTSIQCFKAVLENVLHEAERFNDAVPYMISKWAEVRRQQLNLARPTPNFAKGRLEGLQIRFGADRVHMMEVQTAIRRRINDN